PRFATQLVKKIEAMGGVRTMFLTHKDDVADHRRLAEKFNCQRIMHADDGAQRLGIEQVIRGAEPVQIDSDLIAIPVPGHTRGHMVLLYRNKFLFTGDHLAWSPQPSSLIEFFSAGSQGDIKHVSKDGLTFDYTNVWSITDESNSDAQQLTLNRADSDAQIRVFAHRGKVDTPEKLAQAKKAFIDPYVKSVNDTF